MVFGVIGIITGLIFYLCPFFIIYNLKHKRIAIEKTSGMGLFSSYISSLLWITPYFCSKSISWQELFFLSNLLGACFAFCWNILYLYYYTMSNKFRYTIYIIALIDVAIEIILIELDNVKDTFLERIRI